MNNDVGSVSTSRPSGGKVYLIMIWETKNNLCME